MSSSTLTRKGQTTIPKDIRDRLNLKPGDKIKFIVNADGSVRLGGGQSDPARAPGHPAAA